MPNIEHLNIDVKEAMNEFQCLPKGLYQVIIIDTEMRNTRARDGQYITVQMQLTQGEHKNRILFDNLIIEHPKKIAVKIGRQRLAQLAWALGFTEIDNTENFHNRVCNAFVGIRNTDRGETNNVLAYQPIPKQKPKTQPTQQTEVEIEDDELPF